MKEQLNNITREIQERNNKELTQHEKQENEKLYKKELKKITKEHIKQTFEEKKDKGETINNIFRYMIEEGDYYKDNITEELFNYSIEQVKIKAEDGYNNSNEEHRKIVIEKIYPFKDFDIINDIDDIYIKTLKSIYNDYKIISSFKEEDKKEQAIEELKELFINYYNKLGYINARATLHDINNKQVIINATKQRTRKTIEQNYYKILNEIDRTYKIANHYKIEQEQKAIKNKVKAIEQKASKKKGHKKIYVGAFTVGIVRGLIKASK